MKCKWFASEMMRVTFTAAGSRHLFMIEEHLVLYGNFFLSSQSCFQLCGLGSGNYHHGRSSFLSFLSYLIFQSKMKILSFTRHERNIEMRLLCLGEYRRFSGHVCVHRCAYTLSYSCAKVMLPNLSDQGLRLCIQNCTYVKLVRGGNYFHRGMLQKIHRDVHTVLVNNLLELINLEKKRELRTELPSEKSFNVRKNEQKENMRQRPHLEGQTTTGQNVILPNHKELTKSDLLFLELFAFVLVLQ